MKFKALLLGTAATFAFAGGNAVAADLSVAEPVDYVRVCDAFGSGFWYLPQTDSCFAISGEVAMTMKFDNDINTVHEGDWTVGFGSELGFNFRRMTDYGPLAVDIVIESNGAGSGVSLKEAGFGISNMTFATGYDSVADVAVGKSDGDFKLIDHAPDQLNFAFALDGVNLFLGIEAPGEGAWGSSSTADIPDLAFAIETDLGGVDMFASAVFGSDLWGPGSESGVAVATVLSTSVDMFDFNIGGMWADSNGVACNGLAVCDGWAVGGGALINFNDQFQVGSTLAWSEPEGSPGSWTAGVAGFYNITGGLDIYVDIPFTEDGVGVVEAKLTAALPN